MKYYRYEKENDMSLQEWLYDFLDNKEVKTDCIVTFALGVFDNSHEGESKTSFGNVYVHYIETKPWDENIYECEDFGGKAEILYIYGYTPVEEVIMTRGVT